MATLQSNDQWNILLNKHLGKRKHNRTLATELFYNIVAVDSAVKPAYLLDFGFQPHKLVELVKELYGSRLITSPLNIYQMGTDLLILNQTNICELQQITDLKLEFVFIDVSSSIDKPEKIQDCCSTIKEYSKFIQMLPINLDEVTLYNIEVENINLTTVFGLLLGYPYVYWFNSESHNNNLSMEELKCFEVHQPLHLKTSEFQNNKHKLFSFSVPETLYDDHAKSLVNHWFEKKKKSNPSLELSFRTEILPQVAL